MSQSACEFCMRCTAGKESEAHPGLYNLGMSPTQTWVLMTCESYFQVTEGLQWFHGFISKVAALLHSSPLCFVRLWWAAPSAPPVTQFHFHSPLPDTFSITVRLPRHLCLPPANEIRKRRRFAPRMRSLSDKLNRLCAYDQPLLHILSRYISLLGAKFKFSVFRK